MEAMEEKKAHLFSNRDLRRLIAPMIIEQLLAILVGMSDSIMVASVGEHAVSGVSLVDNIFILLIYLFAALATGGAVVAGQYLGQNNREKARASVNQLILFTALFSIFITVLIYLARSFILHNVFGHIEADVMEAAKIYLVVVSASIPFIALYNAGAAVFRSMGNSKVPMYLSFLMNTINICGNALLIFGFHMGVAGAAVSTLVSRIIAGVGILILLRAPGLVLGLDKPFSFRLDGAMLKKIAYIGVPNGLENGMFQLGKILVLSMIASFGTASIAASMAIITVCSRCVGAGDYDMARYYTRKILKLIHVMIIVFNIVILAAMPLVLYLYNLSDEAVMLTKQIVWWHAACAVLIWPEAFSLANTLRAASDVKYCMVWSVISMWVFRIGFSWLLGVKMQMGVFGVWVAMTIDWLVRAILFIIRYRGTKWQHAMVK